MVKRSPERFKTDGNVFDAFTITTIQKIIDKGLINGLLGPLSIGKESNVFIAKKDDENVIAKIYRLEVCDFKRMYDYLRYDGRFDHVQKRRRHIIFAWVQREYRNLHIARDAGVRVPMPILASNNVLIEEFIGDKAMDMGGHAPKLKDASPHDPQAFYEDLKKMITKLLHAGLVHADLSPFNILNYDERPVLIDFSQSTPLDNPRAKEYYDKDVRNVLAFFSKRGVDCSVDEFEQIWLKNKKSSARP